MPEDFDRNSKHYLEVELENQIRNDPSMWAFLQAGSLDGVWYWDLERPDQEWMSPGFWQLFGIDPATKTHSPDEWQDMIFQEDLKAALENFDKHCADPIHPYDQVVRYRHQDGSTVWVRCRGIAIRDENGKAIRMLGAHNDLTLLKLEEKRLDLERARNSELRLKSKETLAANEELRSFAYAMSHDLKSPANTVRMLIDELFICDGPQYSEGQNELLVLCKDTVIRMQGLIDSLLEYTETIGNVVTKETLDTNQCLSEVLEDLGADIEASGAEIHISDLPQIQAEPTQFRLLMQNLIGNALKFKSPKRAPVINVFAAQSGDWFNISVADNGIGISTDNRGKIFDLFGRLHRKDEVPGHGLGLTICRRIAQNHGGDIGVDKSPEGGAIFTVSFPRAGK